MTDGDSRFRGMPISELQRIRKDYEKAIKGYQHEKDVMGPYATEEPDYIAQQENINDDQAVIDEINAEIRRQADVQAGRDDEFEKGRVITTQQTRSSPKPLETALAAWFRGQRYEATKHIQLAWEVEGRRFVATWDVAPLRLEVWLVVAAGTPGAILRDSLDIMPCNTFEEMKAARVAESKRPRSHPAARKTGPRRAEG